MTQPSLSKRRPRRARRGAHRGGQSRVAGLLSSYGKLPAMVAIMMLCVWPAWIRPCHCLAGSDAALLVASALTPGESLTPGVAATPSKAGCPSCCLHAGAVAESEADAVVDTDAEIAAACSCCSSDRCPCDLRIQSVERIKSSTSLPAQLPGTQVASADFLGSLSLAMMMPRRVPHAFLRHRDPAPPLTAPARCALICSWSI